MFELVLRADEALVEPLTEQLIDELNALSASVEDADAEGSAEQPLFGEPGLPVARAAWLHSRVVALFAGEDEAQTAAALLVARHGAAGLRLEALRAVADQDWVRLTQSQFEPVAITEHFWIVPTWHAVPAAAERAIRLDPGLAFGTGTHPTTRMCLRWIARHAPASASSWIASRSGKPSMSIARCGTRWFSTCCRMPSSSRSKARLPCGSATSPALSS